MTIRRLRAAWVVPMDGPPIRNGIVTFGERIVSIEPAGPHRPPIDYDLGEVVVLPGLINAHTHLELSGCACGESPASFTDWIRSLPQRIGPARDFAGATRAGIAQCLQFGVTTVGDISQQMHVTRPILRGGPIRSVSYGEVLGLGKLVARYEELLPKAVDKATEGDRLRVGVTPHAPYTVDLPGYRRCLDVARAGGLPLATHLAESPYETPFLTDHAGPFRGVWDSLGQWSDDVQTHAGTPIEFAHAIGLLEYPSLLAHVNYLEPGDWDLLAGGNASVVYCPRTHAYFGHPPHQWREMLRRGINVAIGTDSCASSPDLNLLDDLRLVHRLAPDVPPIQLWEMVTTRAAKAIQMHDRIGSIAPGKHADFTTFATWGEGPLTEILESDARPCEAWVGGERVGTPMGAHPTSYPTAVPDRA